MRRVFCQVAIMKYCEIVHAEGVAEYRNKFPTEAEIPFNSANKFQVTAVLGALIGLR